MNARDPLSTTIAMVTIGQAPRSDLVPEMTRDLPATVRIHEVGALDAMSATEIAALHPAPGEARLVTRLADGSEAIVSRAWMNERLKQVFSKLDDEGFDLIVLLCTGWFEGLHSRTPFIEAQRVVDSMTLTLTEAAKTIGVIVPDPAQAAEFHAIGRNDQTVRFGHASPYSDQAFDAAAASLAGSDVIVMHCMGYTESMRERVRARSGKPVLLARRMLGAAIAQLV